MIETLEGIDRWIVLTVNSWNTPLLDEIMWIVAQRITWIPLYLFLLWLGWKHLNRKQFVAFVLLSVLSVALADLISVHLFKNVFERYRPSHHALLTEQLHFYRKSNGEFYKGGMYGFVSSHAANFFALAMIVVLFLSRHVCYLAYIMFGTAVLVSFSRLYQGVHYLSDLLGGAMLGVLISYLVYRYLYLAIVKDKK
jgi:undecaprenyl-diphosphatase